MSESELDDLMGEVGGPCNVMGMVNMFQEKLAGDGNDPDELILQAFMAYDQGGKIDVKMFQHALTTWGDKMNKTEIDDIFNEFDIDEDFMVKTKEVIGLFVAVKEEEKKVEEKPAPVEEAPAEEEDGDAKKKKKKKKKVEEKPAPVEEAPAEEEDGDAKKKKKKKKVEEKPARVEEAPAE